jgi:hypothetical protein
MAQEELEIEIAADGKVTVRTKGIKGPACMEYADLMARIVGREETRETTAEFYESGHVDARTRVNVRNTTR